MYKFVVSCGLFLLMANHGTAQTDQQARSAFSWDDGLKFEYFDTINPDLPKAEIKMGGRLMYDVAFFHQDDPLSEEVGAFRNGLELRRARLYNSGNLFYGSMTYKLQLEFAGGGISFKDAYLEYRLMKLSDRLTGKLRVGQFKEPLRMEVQLSSNHMTFIERSYITGFVPERNTGLMYHIDDKAKKFSLQAGFFGNGNDAGNDLVNNDGSNITARVTYAPVKTSDQVVHLGFGASHRDAGKVGNYTYNTRPPAHTAPKYLDVRISGVSSSQIYNTELVYIRGNLMVESEFLSARIHADRDLSLWGYYGQVSYFLNSKGAKHRHTYKGAYEGIAEDLGKNRAWELAARYSIANFNDQNFNGGEISDITLGVNYHLNSRVRVMANYSFINLDDIGKATDLNLRFMAFF